MSLDPIRRDRTVDLDSDLVFDWYFQQANKTPVDLSDILFWLDIYAGDERLFDTLTKDDMTVVASVAITDERGQAQGTAAHLQAIIPSADLKALTADQKAAAWTYKMRYQRTDGPVTLHDWGECTVLPTEIPA